MAENTQGSEDIIRLEGLRKEFKGSDGTPIVALRDIDLTIRKGDIFGIIGLSGAGKSTLVRCMNYLERPTAGRVIVDGQELGTLTQKQLLHARQQIGMIFQGFNLLSQRDAIGNVCYPMEIAGISRSQARQRAKELLHMVELDDRMGAYPSQMSGGQKQRVAIARALATNPKVLLCDEATSALDPTTTQSILQLLQHINRQLGVTIVVITHEMKVIQQICNRVAVIDQSHIVEMGEVQAIFRNPQSAIARRLIYPQGEAVACTGTQRALQLSFDGTAATEPVIARMVLECRVLANILYADTKTADGKLFGHMVLGLPEEEEAVQRMKAFLTHQGVAFEEVSLDA